MSVLEFPLPASSSFTSFLPVTSSCIFGCSLQLEVSIRKLKLSSSIAVVLQASQTAVVFYQLSSSIVIYTSGLLRLQLTSSIFSSLITTVLLDYSGCHCFLQFFIISKFTFAAFVVLFGYQHLLTKPKRFNVNQEYSNILLQIIDLKIAIQSSKYSIFSQL
jgi:hypothetical protein